MDSLLLLIYKLLFLVVWILLSSQIASCSFLWLISNQMSWVKKLSPVVMFSIELVSLSMRKSSPLFWSFFTDEIYWIFLIKTIWASPDVALGSCVNCSIHEISASRGALAATLGHVRKHAYTLGCTATSAWAQPSKMDVNADFAFIVTRCHSTLRSLWKRLRKTRNHPAALCV